MIAGKEPISGEGLTIGERRAPDNAARPPAIAKINAVVLTGSIPARAAPKRFCATACICLPHKDFLIKIARLINKNIETPDEINFCPFSMIGPIEILCILNKLGPINGEGPITLSTRWIRRRDKANVTTTAYSSLTNDQLL